MYPGRLSGNARFFNNSVTNVCRLNNIWYKVGWYFSITYYICRLERLKNNRLTAVD